MVDGTPGNTECIPIFPEPNTVGYREPTPLELFELFFDDELLEEITKQSNLYARQKNIFESSLDSDEIRHSHYNRNSHYNRLCTKTKSSVTLAKQYGFTK